MCEPESTVTHIPVPILCNKLAKCHERNEVDTENAIMDNTSRDHIDAVDMI